MNAIEKSAAEKDLDALVNDLTAEGMVVVYALGRYDDIPGHGQKARFSTRLSYNDGIDPDPVIHRLSFGHKDCGEVLRAEEELVDRLVDEGWDVFFGYGWDSARVNFSGLSVITQHEDPDGIHRELDLLREVIVEWSNARHTGNLVWQE